MFIVNSKRYLAEEKFNNENRLFTYISEVFQVDLILNEKIQTS